MKSKLVRLDAFSRAALQAVMAAVILVSLSGCVVHIGHHGSDDERHESHESLSMSADGVSNLNIDSGYGAVNVKGVKGADTIEVSAKITSSLDDAADVIFTLENDGDTARLVGKGDNDFGVSYSKYGVSVNMTVLVPAHLALSIHDGSGAIEVAHMDNEITIDDGYGSISVKNVNGDVVIMDDSGALSVSSVTGDVDIKDGSGWIEVSHVSGNLEIEDSSGGMSVEHVFGKVAIDDGSGSIEVRDVNNEVVISDGSGGISVARVSKLNIVEAGSGGVSVVDIETNLSSYLR